MEKQKTPNNQYDTKTVSIAKCKGYKPEEARRALLNLLDSTKAWDFLKPHTKVVIKPNILTFLNPDRAATTHPVLMTELCRILTEHDIHITIGDSPGGLYTAAYINRVYAATGMKQAQEAGAMLNKNFAQREVSFEQALVAKHFTYTSYLDDADVIINFSKLKTHGMMGLSNAVKNMFGVVPGTIKPEYHYKYPGHNDFADMLIDLNEYTRPALCITDAVTAMEGNGPSSGTPRHLGFVAASQNPYNLDLVCAQIIGLDKTTVPTLARAFDRGLAPGAAGEVPVISADPGTMGAAISIEDLAVEDFELVPRRSVVFENRFSGAFGRVFSVTLRICLSSHPSLTAPKCVGCSQCADICPADAIEMQNGLPRINRKKCIDCFCCQEFCPEGALKVKRPFIARILGK